MRDSTIDILTPSFQEVSLFRQTAHQSRVHALAAQTSAADAIVLASILILIQVLDGIFTSMGIQLHGLSAEGNPLLRSLMENIGVGAALVTSKAAAIVISVYLVSLTSKIFWLRSALRMTTVFYVLMAIVPWSVILLTQL